MYSRASQQDVVELSLIGRIWAVLHCATQKPIFRYLYSDCWYIAAFDPIHYPRFSNFDTSNPVACQIGRLQPMARAMRGSLVLGISSFLL